MPSYFLCVSAVFRYRIHEQMHSHSVSISSPFRMFSCCHGNSEQCMHMTRESQTLMMLGAVVPVCYNEEIIQAGKLRSGFTSVVSFLFHLLKWKQRLLNNHRHVNENQLGWEEEFDHFSQTFKLYLIYKSLTTGTKPMGLREVSSLRLKVIGYFCLRF